MIVKSAKLVSGEIVIGEILNENEYAIKFKNLFQITLVPMGPKNVRISIVPLHPFAQQNEEIVILSSHILFWINCPENVIKEYQAYVNPSPIIKPKLSGLIH